MRNTFHIIFAAGLLLISCNRSQQTTNASGIFEANEIMVSAEATGILENFQVEEGKTIQAGVTVGQVECNQLNLQAAQIAASQAALQEKTVDPTPQIAILQEQLKTQEEQIRVIDQQIAVAEKEQKRIAQLVKAEAAPSKQLDDIQGQIEVLRKQRSTAQAQKAVLKQQITSQTTAAALQNRGILSENKPLGERLSQINDLKSNCTIVNPIQGTVLNKYVEQFEMVSTGKALYKIADLSVLTLRAYVTGDQLKELKLGQKVKVFADDTKDQAQEGTLQWISNQAEFTPKSIQTKNERANLVYAIKIQVPNPNGALKLGMFAEVNW